MPDSCPRDGDGENTQGPVGLYDWGDNIDSSTFEQILEMDDDEEDREFSRSIVVGFFEQAETTFIEMDEALESKNLSALSALGHFLKGSSATLGLTKVKNSCEKIQHFGQKKDQEGIADVEDEEKCLERIESTLNIVKGEYAEAVKILKSFFGMSTPSESTTEHPHKANTVFATESEATNPAACVESISTENTSLDAETSDLSGTVNEKISVTINSDITIDTNLRNPEEAVTS